MEKIIAYAGNDVHQEFIKVAVYRGNEIAASIEKTIRNDKGQIQKFYKKLKKEYDIRACYEAGDICPHFSFLIFNERPSSLIDI